MKKLLLTLIFCLFFISICYADQKATGGCYYDRYTNHTYFLIQNNGYKEFSKKGKFLKTVPPDLPLLLSDHVYPVSNKCKIIYQKRVKGKTKELILLSTEPHPLNDWRAAKLLIE